MATRKSRSHFHPSDYMLLVIREYGHRMVVSPDFGFHFTVPLDNDSHRWTQLTLMKAEREIEFRLAAIEKEGKPHPTPRKWKRDILNVKNDLVGISEASRLLGVSPSSLRRLAEDGSIPHSTTRKGHRRFSKDALANSLK